MSVVYRELLAARYKQVRPRLEELTAMRPNDAERHALLAYSWHLDPNAGPDGQNMALVGYETALNLSPTYVFPALMAGHLSYERGNLNDALDFFARAAMANPGCVEAFEGIALTAYLLGDINLAEVASARLIELAPASETGLRLSALIEAASGNEIPVQPATLRYLQTYPTEARQLSPRLQQLRLTAAIDEHTAAQPITKDLSEPKVNPNQVSVDVTIIVSQNTHRDRIGINLLDGLRLQYGAQSSHTIIKQDGGSSRDTQTTFSEGFTLPQINWNLNLFNRFGQYYQVAARPSLTAMVGQTSEFFVGRTLQIGVRGIEAGRIEQVDIGINLKVLPIEIREDAVVVNVGVGRSFVTTDPAGSFAEVLSTFRQAVDATAEIRFGETLVLSGLSESVRDATSSEVPVLGSIPVLSMFFKERSTTERRDAVMIFVTPSPPVSFATRPWARPASVEKMVRLWNSVIDPSTNASDVTERLSKIRMFQRMQPGDAPLSWGNPTKQKIDLFKNLIGVASS
ncbi:hypothetical protein, partial [Alteromonas sp. AMM-1]|uniref:hypothetical protein n=1 Tax=Alteromonas sp. AMM-1 TaxID=3394233 RepID=UPI0039A49337